MGLHPLRVQRRDSPRLQLPRPRHQNRSSPRRSGRVPMRDMRFVGPGKRSKPLFGQHLWRDSGKKLVVVTGEMDAMSVSQAQGHKWPVVSVPNGDDGAKKALMAHIDWLERFEEVIPHVRQWTTAAKRRSRTASLCPPHRASSRWPLFPRRTPTRCSWRGTPRASSRHLGSQGAAPRRSSCPLTTSCRGHQAGRVGHTLVPPTLHST